MSLFFFLETRGLDNDRLLLFENRCRRSLIRMISYHMNLELTLGFFRLWFVLEFHDCDNWCLDGFSDRSAAARARGGATGGTSAFRFTEGLHY